MFRFSSSVLRSIPYTLTKPTCRSASLLPKQSQLLEHVEAAYQILSKNPPKTQEELKSLIGNSSALREALSGVNQEKADYIKNDLLLNYFASKRSKKPVKVVVTGASGAIGYALLPRIASGELLGTDQPIHLSLLELPQALKSLQGVVMELQDCAFPLLKEITATENATRAFDQAEYAFLVGARPRSKGMERGDLLKANAAIFSTQGKVINDVANPDIKVLVVGNPANTNAYIAAQNAPKINPRNFTAMTRLDHNRGLAQLAEKTNSQVTDIKNFVIWGNHSSTQYPDVSYTSIKGKAASELLDKDWVQKTFIPVVQQRGAAIINQRGSSSAASAASAAIDHIRDWVSGSNNEWTSMAIHSDGSYGITKGLYYSYPVVCKEGNFEIVQNLSVNEFSRSKLKETEAELISERDAVAAFIPTNN